MGGRGNRRLVAPESRRGSRGRDRTFRRFEGPRGSVDIEPLRRKPDSSSKGALIYTADAAPTTAGRLRQKPGREGENVSSSNASARSEQAAPWCVADSTEVPERGRLIVEVAGTPLGIFRLDGDLYAYENVCAHQGGPACQGRLVPRVLEVLDAQMESRGLTFDESDMHVVCPWHGFEYSIKTGRHAGVSSLSLRSLPVTEKAGKVYVTL
jgi:nitrite reductase/ring-hydroxylating ferredoxin subunit